MEQKGLTKKQFWVQMVPAFFYLALAVDWLIMSIEEQSVWMMIFCAAYFVLVIAMIVSLIIRRKRHPIEDEEADRQAVGALKDGALGMGIVVGIITVGFLLAFCIAALLT